MAKLKDQASNTSRFFCTKCGKEGIPIARKKGSQREKGHLKKLYCIYCKEEVNHAEVRDIGGYTYEDFLEEYNAGRFVDGLRGDIVECSKADCEYNKNGQCWNCNNSSNCRYKIRKES